MKYLTLGLMGLFVMEIKGCIDASCIQCNDYIQNGEVIEECSSCTSGYVLKDNLCVQDSGPIIGITIAAIVGLILQIGIIYWCRLKYNEMKNIKPNVSLETIHDQVLEQQHKLEKKQQGGNEHSQQNSKVDNEKLNLKKQCKQFVFSKCRKCDNDQPSIRTQCYHFFHLNCLKQQLDHSPGECSCSQGNFGPLRFNCIVCKNRIRTVTINESNSSLQNFKDYICFRCRLIKKKQEDQNRCC